MLKNSIVLSILGVLQTTCLAQEKSNFCDLCTPDTKLPFKNEKPSFQPSQASKSKKKFMIINNGDEESPKEKNDSREEESSLDLDLILIHQSYEPIWNIYKDDPSLYLAFKPLLKLFRIYGKQLNKEKSGISPQFFSLSRFEQIAFLENILVLSSKLYLDGNGHDFMRFLQGTLPHLWNFHLCQAINFFDEFDLIPLSDFVRVFHSLCTLNRNHYFVVLNNAKRLSDQWKEYDSFHQSINLLYLTLMPEKDRMSVVDFLKSLTQRHKVYGNLVDFFTFMEGRSWSQQLSKIPYVHEFLSTYKSVPLELPLTILELLSQIPRKNWKSFIKNTKVIMDELAIRDNQQQSTFLRTMATIPLKKHFIFKDYIKDLTKRYVISGPLISWITILAKVPPLQWSKFISVLHERFPKYTHLDPSVMDTLFQGTALAPETQWSDLIFKTHNLSKRVT